MDHYWDVYLQFFWNVFANLNYISESTANDMYMYLWVLKQSPHHQIKILIAAYLSSSALGHQILSKSDYMLRYIQFLKDGSH